MVLTNTEMPTAKTCRKCGEKKALEEFGASPFTEDGRLHTCRLCTSAAMKAGHARRRAAVAPPPAAMTDTSAAEALSEADWDEMFMLIVFGCGEYIKSMKQCYRENNVAFEVQRAKNMKAFERLVALLPRDPGKE